MILGAVVGFLVCVVLTIVFDLIDFIWKGFLEGETPWWYPLPLCLLGGLLVGLWNKHFKTEAILLGEVIAEVKKAGSFTWTPFFPNLVSFILPITFGGAIGPLAGLSGLIATGCTWVSKALRRIYSTITGQKNRPTDDKTNQEKSRTQGEEDALPDSNPNDAPQTTPFFSKKPKRIMYCLGIAGGIFGCWLVFALGGGIELPYFGPFAWSLENIAWIIPFIAAGYLLILAYKASLVLWEKVAKKLGDNLLAKTLLCGLVLGVVAIAFPFALFPGSEQSTDLKTLWPMFSGATLIAMGFTKAFVIACCMNLGWKGGPFFPIILAGMCIGFGGALLLGVDPLLSTCITATAAVAAFSRKPLMSIVFILVLYSLWDLPWIAATAFIAARLPLPKFALGR